jgi:hypothetical protein
MLPGVVGGVNAIAEIVGYENLNQPTATEL